MPDRWGNHVDLQAMNLNLCHNQNHPLRRCQQVPKAGLVSLTRFSFGCLWTIFSVWFLRLTAVGLLSLSVCRAWTATTTTTTTIQYPQHTNIRLQRSSSSRQLLSPRTLQSKPRTTTEPYTMMRCSNDEDAVFDASLVGDYCLIRQNPQNQHDWYSWSLVSIDQIIIAKKGGKSGLADGAKAVDALMSAATIPWTPTTTAAATIVCKQTNETALEVSVVETEPTTNPDEKRVPTDLLAILQRILVQSMANKIEPSSTKEWSIAIIDGEKSFSMNYCLSEDDNDDNAAAKALFADILQGGDGEDGLEWVEMVTGTGEALGKVPRPLVHKFNILHRGIGLFVTKDAPMLLPNDDGFPSLYVHRRAAIKRIFPSLYDMFVGGVSLANEPPELTARREVAEELGLSDALDDTTSKLSDPILKCVVCTAYNRCVVTLYSYTMDTTEEAVTWQEEEVDWGDFVPYDVVCAAADRSIQRFASQKTWPGTYPPIQSRYQGSLEPGNPGNIDDDAAVSHETENDIDWMKWDFVPDGLLVWEAWLKFLDQGAKTH